jgi:hypothetical protein
MSVPQQCSPGRYSTGGVKDCPRCPAGYFNNIHAATECCACAAGWFNVSRVFFIIKKQTYGLTPLSSSDRQMEEIQIANSEFI